MNFLFYYICSYFGVHSLYLSFFFFLMIRRPPRSTLDRSSAASDVYKRQDLIRQYFENIFFVIPNYSVLIVNIQYKGSHHPDTVSYTHLRAHETVLDLVCRLLLEKKNKLCINSDTYLTTYA